MLHTLYQLIKHHGDGTQDNNWGDHHVELETAAYVIEDENYIEMYDFEHSIEEDRYIAICCVWDALSWWVSFETGIKQRLCVLIIPVNRKIFTKFEIKNPERYDFFWYKMAKIFQ